MRDRIYATTQTLSRDQLAALAEEVGAQRTLLVYCMAFRGRAAAVPNLTVKKIPSAVLHRCEWGKDDYSLQVASLPPIPEAAAPPGLATGPATDGAPRRWGQLEPLPVFEDRE